MGNKKMWMMSAIERGDTLDELRELIRELRDSVAQLEAENDALLNALILASARADTIGEWETHDAVVAVLIRCRLFRLANARTLHKCKSVS